MKKIIKIVLSLVIGTLLFTTAINANETILISEEKSTNVNVEIINEQFIAVPDSTILLKLWEEQLDDGKSVSFYSISYKAGALL